MLSSDRTSRNSIDWSRNMVTKRSTKTVVKTEQVREPIKMRYYMDWANDNNYIVRDRQDKTKKVYGPTPDRSACLTWMVLHDRPEVISEA